MPPRDGIHECTYVLDSRARVSLCNRQSLAKPKGRRGNRSDIALVDQSILVHIHMPAGPRPNQFRPTLTDDQTHVVACMGYEQVGEIIEPLENVALSL